jgi:hypothetical protein
MLLGAAAVKVVHKENLEEIHKEVEGMFSCFRTRQAYVDGQVMTYIVKEQVEIEGSKRETRDVLCACGLFIYVGMH